MLLLVTAALCIQAADERWVSYRRQVTLQGTLLKRYHTEWIDLQGDTPQARELAKTPAFILQLPSPISVRASDMIRQEERNILEIYVILPSGVPAKRLESLIGKQVTVTGQLDHGTNLHHQRPVIMDVTSIR